jgi:hypothetical protein
MAKLRVRRPWKHRMVGSAIATASGTNAVMLCNALLISTSDWTRVEDRAMQEQQVTKYLEGGVGRG